MTCVRAVACRIGHARRHGVAGFTQRRDVGCRNGHAPVAAGVGGGGITDTVQGYGDGGAVRLIAGAGEQQIVALFDRVNHVIARKGVDGDNRRGQGDRNIMRGGGAVARFIREGCREGLIAVYQRADVRGRNAGAPVPGGVQHGGVVFAVEGDGNHVSRLGTRDLTGDDQRLAAFGDIQDVITRHNVKHDLRHGGIHQHGRIGARRVASFIRNGCRDRGITVGDARQLGRRDVERPAAVCLHLRGIGVAIEGHDHRLARFGGGGTAEGQILRRLCRIQDVVTADGIEGDRRRGGIHAVLAPRRCAVAVNVGHAHLHAGIAVLQAAQIRCRNGGGPVAVGVYRRRIRFPAQGNGHGLSRLNVGRGAAEHQVFAFFRRVQHVVSGHAVNADGDRAEIHINDGANRDRVAGGVLRAGADDQ